MTVCRFEGCAGEMRAHGLCGGHYAQQRAGRELVPLIPRRVRPPLAELVAAAVPLRAEGLTDEQVRRRLGIGRDRMSAVVRALRKDS